MLSETVDCAEIDAEFSTGASGFAISSPNSSEVPMFIIPRMPKTPALSAKKRHQGQVPCSNEEIVPKRIKTSSNLKTICNEEQGGKTPTQLTC